MSRFFLSIVLLCHAAVGSQSIWPPLWPIPTKFTNGTSTVTISAAAKFVSVCDSSADLQDAFARFAALIFPYTEIPPASAIRVIPVCVMNASVPLQFGVDESYVLSASLTRVSINCTTIFGCYHGLQTLSQLIYFDRDTQYYIISHMPWTIQDSPRFHHRGVLVDSSRHFLPIRTLEIIVESLTYAKLNVMHWHLVDSNSFPFISSTYRNLSRFGAYSPSERYTHADVAQVVEFARKRGVRVMVEFDTPGHTAAMCYGLPNVCPTPLCMGNTYNWALDITRNVTYDVVGNVIKELASLYFDRFMHLGGDEVITTCWSQHPYIVQWLQERGLSLEGGYEYYVKRVQKIARDMGLTVVGWQEIWDHFGTSLAPSTVIHQWLSGSVALTANVTSHGYRLIWSGSNVWYLDHLAVTWEQMYSEEPCRGLSASECANVIGGEGCMWGETVDTSDSLQTIWPRLAAIAERLWSPATTQLLPSTSGRIAAFRCFINERGIAAAPVFNPIARSAPPAPGSCFMQ